MNRTIFATALLLTMSPLLACGGEPQPGTTSDHAVGATSQAITLLDSGVFQGKPGVTLFTGAGCTGNEYGFVGAGAADLANGLDLHGVKSYMLGAEDGFLATSPNPVHHQDEPFGTAGTGPRCVNAGYYGQIATWLVLTD